MKSLRAFGKAKRRQEYQRGGGYDRQHRTQCAEAEEKHTECYVDILINPAADRTVSSGQPVAFVCMYI